MCIYNTANCKLSVQMGEATQKKSLLFDFGAT